MTCQLVYAGEVTGTLDIMLDRIAQHKEKTEHLRRKFQQVLFYPMMIVVMAFAVCMIMMIFVVPHFEELFLTMHKKLPWLTSAVLSSHLESDFNTLASIFFVSSKNNSDSFLT